MEADYDGTGCEPVGYTECDWGDLIEGTKEQLQALGLGAGLVFPGEAGGPKHELNARDPRGYPVRISNRYRDDGRFTASLKFPGWPVSPWHQTGQWEPAFPGVERSPWIHSDTYRGSAEVLVAAGLVPPGHFPGRPGMRKVRVTIFADGTMPTGAPTANHAQAREPGARSVRRAAAGQYVVTVRLTKDEEAKRRAVIDRAEDAYKAQCRAMPRPAPLVNLPTPSDDRERLANACLATAVAHWGADEVVARVRQRSRRDGREPLAAMGVLHRRKLPAGWRVIEGQGHA